MKKRILSLLLAVCLLCAEVPAALAADDADTVAYYLTKYTFKQGDTMTGACSARGVNFNTYQDVIRAINNISSFNYLKVGQVFWLPAATHGAETSYYTVYKHKVVSGDTVSALCQKYGMSLTANEDMIKAVNDVTNLSSFQVGKYLYLPVPSGSTPGTGAGTSAGTTTTVSTDPNGVTTVTVNPAPVSPAPSNGAKTGDTLAFYLTKYTIQPGDYLTNVCSTRGVKYSEYETIIKNVNKLKSLNNLIAGRSYWLPGTTVGKSAEYYAVYKHTIVSGDTVYNLCNGYGVSMSKYTDLILQLNNTKSLVGFKIGKSILIPVFKTAADTPSGTGTNTGTSANAYASSVTSTVTNEDGSVTTVTTTVTEPTNLFKISAANVFYLIPYTVKANDTIVTICNGLGTGYNDNASVINGVNGLKDGAITTGAKLWIPVKDTSAVTAGSRDYYTVTKHVMARGETAYALSKGATAAFGPTYALLTGLNPGVNFNYVGVGATVLIPVYAGNQSK